MQRRDFMKSVSLGLAAGLILPSSGYAAAALADSPTLAKQKNKKENLAAWNEVSISNQISTEVMAPAQIWLPVPLAQTSYQELLSTTWSGNFIKAGLLKDKKYGASIFYAEWDKPGKIELAVDYSVKLRDRSQPEASPAGSEVDLYLEPTKHIPLDGVVKETAQKIVKSEKDPDKKAKLIYNWMAQNTARDPKTRGCGLGDVKTLLISGSLAGKCADLSSLFVGLCRAAGVPAREVFGLRVLPSEISPSIGKVGDVSKAQHCRAEYFSAHKGWVPVDPADVRKVILEEKLDPQDAHVQSVQSKLFGFWEMNWVAYNSARDFDLPPSYKQSTNYLMYPLLVSGSTEKDGMEPDKFNYSINSKKII